MCSYFDQSHIWNWELWSIFCYFLVRDIFSKILCLFQFLTLRTLCRFGQMKQSNDKTLSVHEKRKKKCDAISSIETGLRSNTGLTSSDSDWCPLHDLGNILISCAVDRTPFPHWTRSTLYPPLNRFYPIRFSAAPVFPAFFFPVCLCTKVLWNKISFL